MMAERTETEIRLQVNERMVTVKAMDAVGVDDCMDIMIRAMLHKLATGEDLLMPIPREVKDFMIKQNLEI